MPYASLQHSNFERLNQAMNFGIWGNVVAFRAKFKINIIIPKSSCIYNNVGDKITTKNSLLLQYQSFF